MIVWIKKLAAYALRKPHQNTCFLGASFSYSGFYVVMGKDISLYKRYFTVQKMKLFIKYFFSKCEQIRRKLLIWSHLLKKTLMKNFIFCALFDIEIGGAPAVALLSEPCCKLFFIGFLHSAVPYWD